MANTESITVRRVRVANARNAMVQAMRRKGWEVPRPSDLDDIADAVVSSLFTPDEFMDNLCVPARNTPEKVVNAENVLRYIKLHSSVPLTGLFDDYMHDGYKQTAVSNTLMGMLSNGDIELDADSRVRIKDAHG